MSGWWKSLPNGLSNVVSPPKSGHRRAAKGMEFPWRCNVDTIAMDLKVSWEMSVEVELVIDPIQRAIPVPQAEVIMHGASRRQVLGQRAPLAAGAHNVHHAVDHLAHLDAAFAAAALGRRDQRLDIRPFFIGQVVRIAQRVVVVARAVVSGLHQAPHGRTRYSQRQSQAMQTLQEGHRLTDSADAQSLQTDT